MANSAQQVTNIISAFCIAGTAPAGPCLLVDDIFDSRWTLTVAGFLIAQHGGGPVYPFALAKAADRRTLD
jgi:ATP-dependent DNA helicase RecQ